jgi:WD40 repeat protein
MRFIIWTFLFCVIAIAPCGIGTAADDVPALDKAAAEKISFRGDVWPIVKRHCWGCHNGAEAKGGLSMDGVAAMIKGGDSGPLFVAGKPDESLLLEMTTGEAPEMPKKQPPLSAEKIHILRQWIFAGAKDDSKAADDEAIVSIPATYRFAPAVTSVAFSADGKLLAAACRSEVVLIDVEGETPPRRLATQCDLLTHVEFSPDGALLAAAGGSPARYGEVRFFNVADGNSVGERRIGRDTLFRGNFSPDGKAIALGGADGAVYIVPVNKGGEVRQFDLHTDWVTDVAYSPDGKLLVSGGRDKATKVSSVETGQLLRGVDISGDIINAVASDENFAVSAGRDRQLNGYEYKVALSGAEIRGMGGNGLQPVNKKSQYLKAFEGQPGEVFDMAASGDRKLIATVGMFGEVRVYRIADRGRAGTIGGVAAPIYSVALDADGKRVAIGSANGTVSVYEVATATLLKSLVPVPVEVASADAR